MATTTVNSLNIPSFYSPAIAAELPVEAISPPDLTSTTSIALYIKNEATKAGLNPTSTLEVATCESGLNTTIYGDKGLAYGVFQFHRQTFDVFAKEKGEKLDYFNPKDNIDLAIWGLSHGKQSHWTCAYGKNLAPISVDCGAKKCR